MNIKVIRALCDREPESQNIQELPFHKGDFFHVISREDDPNWYEACNPLIPSARGLVPVTFFEVIEKTERQSTGPAAPSASHTLPPHDSGYSEKGGHSRHESNATAKHIRMSSIGKGSGAMVYGVVQYDFSAERPDELDAKSGEAIIVIAQSNPEWFVAKPIGRLGGPGLIPVSYVEIRDMSTGKAVPNAQEAVSRAGVPKVEEWKKMAKDYRDNSIPLGRIDTGDGRLSVSNTVQPNQTQNGHGQVGRTALGRMSTEINIFSLQGQLLAPVSASIPRYCFDNDKYWYIVEVVLEDGRHWELSRFYQDFYDFQVALLQQFDVEAGTKGGGPRTIPYMPGPVTYVTDAISNGRRQNLDEYVKKLLTMAPHISRCLLVRQLFAPREGDFEMDPNAMGEDYRLSTASQQSSTPQSTPQDSGSASRQSSHGNIDGSNGYVQHKMAASQTRSNHQRGQSSATATNNGVAQATHYRQPSDMHPQAINRQPSSLTQASQSSGGAAPTPSPAGALKIKVFFQDDLIAIRVPSDIIFQQLKDKLKDRLKVQEDIIIQYKDEPSNGYAEILSDHDLDVAIQRNPKLTLYVGYA